MTASHRKGRRLAGGGMTPLEQRVRHLELALVAFVALHILIVPLLPRLFDRAPAVAVAALVLGAVLLVLWTTRRPER